MKPPSTHSIKVNMAPDGDPVLVQLRFSDTSATKLECTDKPEGLIVQCDPNLSVQSFCRALKEVLPELSAHSNLALFKRYAPILDGEYKNKLVFLEADVDQTLSGLLRDLQPKAYIIEFEKESSPVILAINGFDAVQECLNFERTMINRSLDSITIILDGFKNALLGFENDRSKGLITAHFFNGEMNIEDFFGLHDTLISLKRKLETDTLLTTGEFNHAMEICNFCTKLNEYGVLYPRSVGLCGQDCKSSDGTRDTTQSS